MANEPSARDRLDAVMAWDRWEAWAGWEHAEVVELLDAAYLLTATKPCRNQYKRVLPAMVDAMLQTLQQTILLGHLPVFAVWGWNEDGECRAINVRDVTPHTVLHGRTTVKVCDLAQWCDSRGIAHPWSTSTTRCTAAMATYPDELCAAIEVFEAVHGDAKATSGRSAKQALTAWLEVHKPGLSANARERIATVANWQQVGGAPKTPGD